MCTRVGKQATLGRSPPAGHPPRAAWIWAGQRPPGRGTGHVGTGGPRRDRSVPGASPGAPHAGPVPEQERAGSRALEVSQGRVRQGSDEVHRGRRGWGCCHHGAGVTWGGSSPWAARGPLLESQASRSRRGWAGTWGSLPFGETLCSSEDDPRQLRVELPGGTAPPRPCWGAGRCMGLAGSTHVPASCHRVTAPRPHSSRQVPPPLLRGL